MADRFFVGTVFKSESKSVPNTQRNVFSTNCCYIVTGDLPAGFPTAYAAAFVWCERLKMRASSLKGKWWLLCRLHLNCVYDNALWQISLPTLKFLDELKSNLLLFGTMETLFFNFCFFIQRSPEEIIKFPGESHSLKSLSYKIVGCYRFVCFSKNFTATVLSAQLYTSNHFFVVARDHRHLFYCF